MGEGGVNDELCHSILRKKIVCDFGTMEVVLCVSWFHTCSCIQAEFASLLLVIGGQAVQVSVL